MLMHSLLNAGSKIIQPLIKEVTAPCATADVAYSNKV